jgi:hypothetical protein
LAKRRYRRAAPDLRSAPQIRAGAAIRIVFKTKRYARRLTRREGIFRKTAQFE